MFRRAAGSDVRGRTKPSRLRRGVTIAVDQTTAAPPERVKPSLLEQFHVAVDRQLKSGHGTYAAAAKVALAIKKRYPHLQVTVYDTKGQRHTIIEQQGAATNPTSHRAGARPINTRGVTEAGIDR